MTYKPQHVEMKLSLRQIHAEPASQDEARQALLDFVIGREFLATINKQEGGFEGGSFVIVDAEVTDMKEEET